MIIVFGCYWSVNGDPFNHFYTAKAYSQQKDLKQLWFHLYSTKAYLNF